VTAGLEELNSDLKMCDHVVLIQILAIHIICSPVFLYLLENHVSETGLPLSVGGPKIGTSSIDWAQLSRIFAFGRK
jgi:hypothetical protein